jgi:hypothetical protein
MKSENYGHNQAGEGSAFVFEGVILVLAALVGATITVIGGFFIWAWKGAQKISTPFLPTREGLESALKRTHGNTFKAVTLSLIELLMGREIEVNGDVLSKLSEIPPQTEGEARAAIEELGYSVPSDFKHRWDKLCAEGKVAREEAAKPAAPAPAPVHRGPSIGDIFGIARMALNDLKGLIPVPAPAAPSAAEQARAIEVAVAAALAKRAQAAKPAAKPRIALNAKQRAAVRAKAVKAVKAVKAATPPAVPAGKP